MAKTTLFDNISELLTLTNARRKASKGLVLKDLSIIKDGAFAVEKGRIIWVGKRSAIPAGLKKGAKRVSLGGAVVMPGFVECHTHLVFGGSRANEFEMRNQGATYQEIANAGGGIVSTVKETRKIKESQLLQESQKLVDNFVRQGITTLEVKSGYGLVYNSEKKMLSVASQLKGPLVVPTYLGPHAVPNECQSAQDYMGKVLRDLPKIAKSGLVKRADIFIESGYFDKEMGRVYLEKARALGLELTIHADQLTRTGAGQLGVEVGARSVDHLVQINNEDIKAISKADITATLLPAADFYLKMKYPPARKLLDSGARVAVSTDFNPGSSPTQDLSFVGVLARMEMKMALYEVIASYTLGAAFALGLEDAVGSLEVGKQADFAVLKGDWRELFYHVGDQPIQETWKSGKKLKIS